MMLWPAMILILMLQPTAAKSRAQYTNETYFQYMVKMESEEPCYVMQKKYQNDPLYLYEEQTVSIALLWNDTLEYAAAALLRATLMFTGFNGDFIELYKRDSIDLSAENSQVMIIIEGPAKNELHLQVRLTPRAAKKDKCWRLSNFDDLKFGGTEMLSNCDFMVSETNKFAHYTIYIVKKWSKSSAAEEIKRIKARSAINIHLIYLDHSNLTFLIHNSNRSFFFLNTYQQSKPTKISPIILPVEQRESFDVLNTMGRMSTKVKNTVVMKYAIANYTNEEVPEKLVKFIPSVWTLGSMLTEHSLNSNSYYDNMKKTACRWINKSGKYHLINKIMQQSDLLDENKLRYIVIICESEVQDIKEYLYMIKVLGNYKKIDISTLLLSKNAILIQTIIIDCANANKFIKKVMNWLNNPVITTYSVVGIVRSIFLTNEVAIATAPFVSTFFLPLITYDVYSGKPQQMLLSATGSVQHLVLALQRLLVNCGWQRLAIISEQTPLAVAVSTALRISATQLTLRDLKVTSTSDIQDAIQELLNADARVFFINAGAATAAAVLAAAQKFNLTRDKGFAWIVREYNAADYATTAIRPFSVSFWWRGERKNELNNGHELKVKVSNESSKAKEKEITDEVALRLKLEEKWRGRAWPLHAAPLLDALLTLIKIQSNNDYHNNLIPWVQRSNYLRNMKIIPGINQDLTYDNNSVRSPLIFVEQWGSEPRPRLLATWRGGEWPEHAEACPVIDPPPDGSSYCLLPYGDPFQPNCREHIWMLIVFAAFIGTILIIAVIYWSRKAFLAHNLRIKTEYAKRMLARRERVFEALAEHLVDRKALELIQEIGTGRFGRVHQGVLRESGSKHRNVIVAAKALREDASSTEESEFLREACTLATLDYEHIISFVGVCVIDGPPLLLMEHAFFGDLLQYLQARRCLAEGPNLETTNRFETDEKAHVSAKAITKLAQEAALALAYLAQRGIVHRDVRASNCLVDERRCLKLADFGLARATGTIDGEYQMCRRGLLPVLWMAPESLAKGVSSPASDVWSFGVLVFELVTLGQRPYGVQPPPVVLRHVVAGGRPQLPWDASPETWALTRACWRQEPEARPPAARLADWLSSRWRALRPALVTELVDIDSLMNDKDFNEPDLCPSRDTLQTNI